MNDIEQLMRKHLKNAEQQPPEGTWDEIARRLDGAVPTESASEAHIRIKHPMWVAVATTVVLIAATAIYFAIQKPTDSSSTQQANLIQNTLEPMPAMIDSNSIVETTVCTTVNPEGQVVKPVSKVDASQSEVTNLVSKTTATVTTSRNLPSDYVFPSELFDFDTTEWVKDDEPVKAKPVVADSKSEKPVSEPRKGTEKKEMPYINIPNILTPNGDGANDCWVIQDLEQYGKVQVRIYTARRQKVYSSDNYQNDFCGAGLSDGNYFYEMAFRDYKVVRRGVLVIKH